MHKNAKKALREFREKVKAGEITPVRRTPTEKARANPRSLRLAVNAHCYECNGRENWHSRTRYCNVTDCPLWPVRPGGKGISEHLCKQWKERC